MTRSPLAYPLNRGADMDVGGAADLQTDVMRFMAIISLCLVAIFALVQSMPMSPLPETEAASEMKAEPDVVAALEEPPPKAQPEPEPQTPPRTERARPIESAVTLTRPKWTPKYPPKIVAETQSVTAPVEEAPIQEQPVQPSIEAVIEAAQPVVEEAEGFTLRFESDAALTRLVAASKVGVYAMESERARRMTVSESRISFWDASVPNSFHEMELSTVPAAVINALSRTGIKTADVSWGVTLPGKLKNQLDQLMQNNGGGALVIAADGEIRLEES